MMSKVEKKKKKSATKDLLNNEDVRRWYDNTSRGSKLNADIRLRRLNLFCYRTNTTPAKLVRIGRKDVIKIENMLLDHVSWLESQNYAPNYIDGILKSIKSLFQPVMTFHELKKAAKKKKSRKKKNSLEKYLEKIFTYNA